MITVVQTFVQGNISFALYLNHIEPLNFLHIVFSIYMRIILQCVNIVIFKYQLQIFKNICKFSLVRKENEVLYFIVTLMADQRTSCIFILNTCVYENLCMPKY